MYAFDSFKYVLQNDDNRLLERITIGLLLLFIPLFGPVILMGYGLRIIRHYANGQGMPVFNDLAGDVVRGIMVFVAAFVYTLPLIAVILILSFTFGFTASDGGFNGLLFTLIMALIFVAAIFINLVLVLAIVRYAIKDEISALFQFGTNFNTVLNNAGAGITFILNTVVFAIVASILVMIGFMLLFIPGMLAAVVVQFGQFFLYARYAEDLGILGKAKRKNQENAAF